MDGAALALPTATIPAHPFASGSRCNSSYCTYCRSICKWTGLHLFSIHLQVDGAGPALAIANVLTHPFAVTIRRLFCSDRVLGVALLRWRSCSMISKHRDVNGVSNHGVSSIPNSRCGVFSCVHFVAWFYRRHLRSLHRL